MRTLPVKDLKPGMQFDQPVYVDDATLLVPERVPIKEKDLKRLEKWKIETVRTAGQEIVMRRVGKEGEAQSGSFFQQAFNTPEQQQVLKTYSEVAQKLRRLHQRVREQDDIEAAEVDRIIDAVLQLLGARRHEMIEFILYGFQGEAGYVENAINSAVLSSLIGINSGMAKHKLLHLATAALLHDIGMTRLPEEIFNKSGKLTTEELKQIRTHPIHSYKIITRELHYPEQVGLAALQHQERWDGTGYPRGLSGSSIIIPARIIAVVDSFEAMVSKRPYRNSMIGYNAIRAILSDNGRRFDPEVLKIFIRTMGIYPIGSIVLLNDGRIGRVVRNNVDAPLKPKVKIMINEKGQEYHNDHGEIVDLFDDRKLFITRAVDPKELNAQPGGQAPQPQ